MTWRAMGAATACAVLAACGSAPTAPGPRAPVEPHGIPPIPSLTDPALQQFVQRQAASASADEARGRWGDAADAWERVLLAQPDHPAAPDRLQRARQRARAEAEARQANAEVLRQRGQLDAAATTYLEALALDPDRPAVADALRQIEHERERRRLDNRNLRLAAPARRMDEPAATPAAPDAEQATRRLGAAREHAAMLSAQGDLDGAIQVLKEALPAKPDARSRTALADLYVRKGEALRDIDRKAARAAVDAALALDRRHVAARSLLRQLSAQPTSAPAPATRP